MKPMCSALYAYVDKSSYAKYYPYCSSLNRRGRKLYIAVISLFFALMIFSMSFGERSEVVYESSIFQDLQYTSVTNQGQSNITSENTLTNYDTNTTFFQIPPIVLSKNIIFRSASSFLSNNLPGKLMLISKAIWFKGLNLLDALWHQNFIPSISDSGEYNYYFRC